MEKQKGENIWRNKKYFAEKKKKRKTQGGKCLEKESGLSGEKEEGWKYQCCHMINDLFNGKYDKAELSVDVTMARRTTMQ